MLEGAEALAMADRVFGFAPERPGRRGPNVAGLLVAEIDDLPQRIGDRIIAPRRQAVRLAVAAPGEARATFGNEEAKLRIGDDVDPRLRRQALFGDPHAIF